MTVALPRVRSIARRFASVRVLIVGDLMLDEFIWGRVDRISPEAPVPVVRVTRESIHLGGAANVVHNVRALGGRATTCGVLGVDRAGQLVLGELKRIGARTSGVIRNRSAVTIRKTRIVAHSQQVVRFDREEHNHPETSIGALVRYLSRHATSFDAVLVSDYGKGVVCAAVLEALHALSKRRRLHLIVDPKKPNYDHYRGVTLATPNVQEAGDAAGIEIRDEHSLQDAGRRLLDRWQAEAILVTRGEQGMSLFRRGAKPRHFPTVARDVYDVTGAGDTVAATCALALGGGATFEEAAFLANHAAGVVVGKVGTATLTADELVKAVEHGE